MRWDPKANRLRIGQTSAEVLMWHHLRNRRLNGCKFRRQVPVGSYIADFLSHEAQLIVELDGGQHDEQEERDMCRDEFLREQGYTVLRFWNCDILANADSVLKVIAEKLVERGFPFPDNKKCGRC